MKYSYFTGTAEELPPDMSKVILNTFVKLIKNLYSIRDKSGTMIHCCFMNLGIRGTKCT
jgi:hypothetical protein